MREKMMTGCARRAMKYATASVLGMVMFSWSSLSFAWEWPTTLYIGPGQVWRSPPIILNSVPYNARGAIGSGFLGIGNNFWNVLNSFIVPQTYNLGNGLTYRLVGDNGTVTPTGLATQTCAFSIDTYYGTPSVLGGTQKEGSIKCTPSLQGQGAYDYIWKGIVTGVMTTTVHVEITNTNPAGTTTNVTWPTIYGTARAGTLGVGYTPDYWVASGWLALVPGGQAAKIVSTGLNVNVVPSAIRFSSKSGQVMARGDRATNITVSAATGGSTVPVGLELSFSDGVNTINTSSPDVVIHGSTAPDATCNTPGKWLTTGSDLYIPLGYFNDTTLLSKNIYWMACIASTAMPQTYTGSVEYHVSVY
ncbi:MAG TPA: hypothetical protein VGI71_16725 [Scandinavium sp.]